MFELNLDTTEKVVSVVAGAFAIIAALTVWWRGRAKEAKRVPELRQDIDTGDHNQTVNVNIGASAADPLQSRAVTNSSTIADLKRTTSILFVDDDRGFKIVSVLRKMGWDHTKLVTDITSLEQAALLEAHVIFVDIQGVGKTMQYADEGLGLALAIKRRHPRKKVVIYSAEETGARFHEALQEADYSLPKTAEPIRFEDTIVRVISR